MDFRVLRYTISFKPQIATQISAFFWSIGAKFELFPLLISHFNSRLSIAFCIWLLYIFYSLYFSHYSSDLFSLNWFLKKAFTAIKVRARSRWAHDQLKKFLVFRWREKKTWTRQKIVLNCSRNSWRARNTAKALTTGLWENMFTIATRDCHKNIFSRDVRFMARLCWFYSKSLRETLGNCTYFVLPWEFSECFLGIFISI